MADAARTQDDAEPSGVTLQRALGLRDLVLFNLVAVVGLRWLATAAKAGPSALALWMLAGLFFFVPQGLVVTELASRFPQEGGIYQWTKRALGERHGYVCGWCYWINNVLYYPNLLISTAVIATFVIGKGESSLASNWTYVLTATDPALKKVVSETGKYVTVYAKQADGKWKIVEDINNADAPAAPVKAAAKGKK